MATPPTTTTIDTLIVGAGFSGICLAIQLRQAGQSSFLLIDKNHDIGGTWTLNRYPGCCCDIPSHLYSFSFEPNPEWSSMYAQRGEIHDYLKSCAEGHGILSHVRLKTVMLEAAWDEDAALWHVDVSTDETNSRIDAHFLVSAMGGLDVPKYPDIKGVQNFVGPSFHSKCWDPSLELEGKTVAVIGTGASAIQIVPAIAPITSKLYVFQRTPAWILPKPEFQISGGWKDLLRRQPMIMWLFSCVLFWVQECMVMAFLGVRMMRKLGEMVARKQMERYIKDTELRAALTPRYELGCKRVLLSNTFYAAMARPNVELVTDRIKEVREHSIVCSKVAKHVDVIIYATGFHAGDRSHVRIIGRAGIELSTGGWDTFLGITKEGFPNFFMLLGPNTGLGHTSQLLMIEAQVRYILSCMHLLVTTQPPLASLEPRPAVQQCFQALLRRRFPSTVWHTGGCHSWYFDPKSGQNYTIWPGSILEYRYRTRSASPSDYHTTT